MDISFDTDALTKDKVKFEVRKVLAGLEGMRGSSKLGCNVWLSAAWRGFAKIAELKQANNG